MTPADNDYDLSPEVLQVLCNEIESEVTKLTHHLDTELARQQKQIVLYVVPQPATSEILKRLARHNGGRPRLSIVPK